WLKQLVRVRDSGPRVAETKNHPFTFHGSLDGQLPVLTREHRFIAVLRQVKEDLQKAGFLAPDLRQIRRNFPQDFGFGLLEPRRDNNAKLGEYIAKIHAAIGAVPGPKLRGGQAGERLQQTSERFEIRVLLEFLFIPR